MVSISVDVSLVVQIINFLVLMLALNFLLYKPIRKILAERKSLFDSLKGKAAEAKAQLERSEDEQRRLAAESLRLGLEAKNGLKTEGLAEEKNILAEAQSSAAKELEEARARLARETEEARKRLAEETRVIAWEMAGKVLGRSL